MASDPEIEDLQGQIDVLTQKIESLSDEMGKLETSSGGFKSNVGDTINLLGDAIDSVVAIRKEFSRFAVDTQAQYKYAENLAKTSKKTAVNMGMSVGRSQEFTKQFNLATSQLQKFGLEAADVNNIMTEYAEKSGRARILSPDEVLQIGLMERGLGVSAENAAVLYEKMDLMGVSATDASKSINQMVAESQKLGLNASKVAKVLSNNFDSMSTMSFSNGVKGMTKMAQLAVKMRVDVSDMLSMSEKFYEPEAAIEAAANLQMLGGDIAKAFGDPFETMYLARNKPEELAERVGDMVENMMQFNEKTGEYEFPAEVRMQLKAAGTQLGINTDKMIDMARQAAKIKDIKMNVSGNIQDEDMREGLASMARMKDGKWVVDFKGEEIDIGDVGMDKAAEILSAPKDADEAIMEMAYNSMTTNEILENILDAMKTGLVAESNVYEITEDVLRPGMKSMMEGVESQVQNAIKLLQDTPVGQFRERMIEQAEALGIASGEGMKKFFEGDFATTIAVAFSKIEWGDIFESDIKEILKKNRTMGADSNVKDIGAEKEDDFLLRDDGTKVSFSSEDDIIGAKIGGPLDKLMDKGLPNNMAGGTTNSKVEFGNINISGRIEIVSPDGSTNGMDMSSLKPQIEKMIISHMNGSFRNGGVSSSKETTDYMG
jgi:hypothetical protein